MLSESAKKLLVALSDGGGGRGKGEYCKLPLISPGLIHPSYVVLRGLYPRGLINGGAYTLGGL